MCCFDPARFGSFTSSLIDYTSTTTAAATSSGTRSSSADVAELKEMVSQLATTVKLESEKQVVFMYAKWEEFDKNIKDVRLSQKG